MHTITLDTSLGLTVTNIDNKNYDKQLLVYIFEHSSSWSYFRRS